MRANGARRPIDGDQPAALLNLLTLPLHVRDLIFLGHIAPRSPLSGVTGAGALSVACYLAVVLGSVAVVLARYRSAEQ
jgi:hypothetical protein